MAGHAPSDPKKLPVVWKERAERDLDHFTREWWSGGRGGGAVPADFTWPTSPKQSQEENGAGEAEAPISR
jgi:hypothetical protein